MLEILNLTQMPRGISATQASSVCLTYEPVQLIPHPLALGVRDFAVHLRLPKDEVIDVVFVALVQVVGNFWQVAVFVSAHV